MDPLTVALQLALTVAQIIKLVIESQPPEVRAERARLELEALQRWIAFVERFAPHASAPNGPA